MYKMRGHKDRHDLCSKDHPSLKNRIYLQRKGAEAVRDRDGQCRENDCGLQLYRILRERKQKRRNLHGHSCLQGQLQRNREKDIYHPAEGNQPFQRQGKEKRLYGKVEKSRPPRLTAMRSSTPPTVSLKRERRSKR